MVGVVGIAGSLLKGSALAKRLRPPSEKRASRVADQLVQSANAGNATAARAILERTRFGIAKERAVWTNALAQVDHDIVLAVSDPRPRAIPQIDHSNPEAAARFALSHPVDISQLATPTSAKVKVSRGKEAGTREAVGEGSTSRTRGSTRQGRTRQAAEPEVAELYEGRQRKAYERATGERWATRYDPETRIKYRVPESAPEYESWPARKPSARSRGARARQRAERAVESAGGRAVSGVLSGGSAVAGPALGIAAAGAIAYLVTSKIIEQTEEGITMENVYGNAVALAHTQAKKRLGREVTRAEHAQLRRAIADAIREELDRGTLYGQVRSAVRSIMNLFRS